MMGGYEGREDRVNFESCGAQICEGWRKIEWMIPTARFSPNIRDEGGPGALYHSTGAGEIALALFHKVQSRALSPSQAERTVTKEVARFHWRAWLSSGAVARKLVFVSRGSAISEIEGMGCCLCGEGSPGSAAKPHS
jgi:hypothetical protein